MNQYRKANGAPLLGRPRLSKSSSGIALILVLGFLVLITGLVVAFFSSVTTELGAASSYAAGASAKQLADSAVGVIMAQIKTATSGSNTAWASQPGMIRTYDDTGKSVAGYKLYSSSNMVVATTGTFNPGADVPPAGWDKQTAFYTDLNARVITTTGTNYPIVDPRAEDELKVEGFEYKDPKNPAPVATGTNANPLPMPVRWLYMLKDGTLTVPDDPTASATTTATFTGKTIPTASNPIVGRIAFWTDDETCKLNLNTACGGNPWDPPMFSSTMDMQFSRFGPVKNEFTRYPGHPATTSLLPVFWSFAGLAQPQVSLFPTFKMLNKTSGLDTAFALQITSDYSGKTNEEDFQKKALLVSPRNLLGGSQLAKLATSGAGAITETANLTDTDRLYASVDEVLFDMPLTSGSGRPANAFAPAMTTDAVSKFRFFLTTSSRAPEVNLLNLPKVTMWPEPDVTKAMAGNTSSPGNAQNRTAVDQLIAFCSTLNGNPYYFTRYDSTSATNDFAPGSRNVVLYNYINGLLKKAIPGFGGRFDGQAGRKSDQILTLSVDYIRSAINLVDPTGVSAPLADKFKYAYTKPPLVFNSNARIGLDTGTGQVTPASMPNGTKGIGRFPTVKSATLMFIAKRANQPPVEVDAAMQPVTPNSPKINPMHPWQGTAATAATITGANVTASGGALYGTHPGMPYFGNILTTATGAFKPNTAYVGPVLQPYQTQMEAIFFIEPVNVGVGYTGLGSNYRIEVDGLNQFKIKDRTGNLVSLFPNVPNKTSEIAHYDSTPAGRAVNYRYGGDSSYNVGKETHTILRWSGGTDQTKLNYWSGPDPANTLIVGPGSSSSAAPYGQAFDFKGGDITVRIYPANGTTPVQTLTINFPDSTNGFPTPRLIAYKPAGRSNGLSPGAVAVDNLSFDAKDAASIVNSRLGLVSSTTDGAATDFPSYHFTMPETGDVTDSKGRYKFTVDTIRSVESTYGDTRLIAALANVPPSFFTPHVFYQDNLGTYNQTTAMWSQPWARSAHTIRRGGEDRFSQAYNGVTTGATMQPLADFVNIASPASSYYGDWGNPSGADAKAKTMVASFKQGPLPAGYSYGNPRYSNNWPNTTSSVDFSEPNFAAIWKRGGDFDNGPIDHADGPYINKAVEGVDNTENGAYSPDFEVSSQIPAARIFSPNRQVPSAVMFGSLPRGIDPGNAAATLNSAWQTLLFCPNPNSQTHAAIGEVSLGGAVPVAGKAPDFLLLDFFHMPVVEPYAISEPFSTAGKVNMNYQIAPFTYINRDTALRGVLASTLLTAVPDKYVRIYKCHYFYGLDTSLDSEASSNASWYFRYPIHADQTLQQFQNRFNKGDLFRSASEICSLFLYPARQPASSMDVAQLAPRLSADSPGDSTNIRNWWYSNPGVERKSLTGDNMRERPYALLYPRLTTKSNTYTVHFRVQRLKKSASTPAAQWDEVKDQVVGEYRGSTLIERYVDPGDPTLPDFATLSASSNQNLDSFYKFRVVSTKKFAP